MSVAVFQPVPLHLENYGRLPPPSELVAVKNDEDRPGQFDIWNAIWAQKAAAEPPAPFVPPSVRRSLSQTSLQICTESLGSENGSDDFFSPLLDGLAADEEEVESEGESRERELELLCRAPEQSEENGRLTSVNYHCSGGARRSPPRSYPPPLLSMCRRDGRCLHMRRHRRDGRLVVEAVPAPSQNYLHAQRAHGRLLLSFIDAITSDAVAAGIEQNEEELEKKQEETEAAWEEEEVEAEEEEDEEEEEEEEEEEVEVVDRGTIVEVKVASMKVLRSSLVINKFVGGELPPPEYEASALDRDSSPGARRAPATTTTATAAAAVVVASTLSAGAEACNEDGAIGDDGCHQVLDNKVLFTSKRRNREELLRSMRRCSELRRPWFIWEPCCIATSY